jgi:3-deoxy-D-manno-octulosonic-acid transferase
MKILYNLGILLYSLVARLIAPFNTKAKLWVNGRKNWEVLLKEAIDNDKVRIWIHCASLGEFEQGRTLIETIKQIRPEYSILLTFFSPSGYEIRKNYKVADHVCYLPSDTPRNARKFILITNPAAVIFVKYEFWYNYISIIHRNGIPFYLVSAIFRPDHHFFRWYGYFFRSLLLRFTHIFVQDTGSAELLNAKGINNVTVSGDTRFDRVIQIAESAKQIHDIETFRGKEKVLIAGSSWKPDEEIIAKYINASPEKLKWIFAPHEIDSANLDRLEKLFKTSVIRLSEFTPSKAHTRVLIIDSIGILSSAYRYGYIAVIGGGFGKGIHNILEAASWGIPVIFGPNYKKFREAVDLIDLDAAKCFHSYEEFSNVVNEWFSDDRAYELAARQAVDYVTGNSGATDKILKIIMLKDINNPFS